MATRTIPQGLAPVLRPITLASGRVVSVASTLTLLKRITTPSTGVSYLESLAYYAQTAGATVTFKFFANGQEIGEFTRNTQLGEIGRPQPVQPYELPPASNIEVYVYDTTGSINCECDGEINTYDERL